MGAEMSDVGEGAGFDSPAFAIGFAEEDGGRGVAIGDRRHVHVYNIQLYNRLYKYKIANLHAYRKDAEAS